MIVHSSTRVAVLPAFLIVVSLAWAQDSPDTVLRGTKQFRKSVVTSGLAGPWEVTWGPDNKLWVTERTGKRVTRIDPASGERKVAITINEVSAPGGQDGLLGMALHPDLLKGKGNDYVYVAYTYVDEAKGPDPSVADPNSPYRFLYAKVVRLSYNAAEQTLASPVTLISGLPAGNDHVAGRLKFGPDRKLYLTLGDQGNNQLGNFCIPAESQRLPTKKELDSKNYVAYVGKSLRINPDGSIPKDNPKLAGVVSHVYTYGHRNTQGIDFAPDGTLYASEHGPKTDDEINILKAGGNYGWPNVAGLRDNKAFEYARWADASTPCSQLRFSDLAIHPSVPREAETAFKAAMIEPIATMFTVATGFDFQNPICKGVHFICWPTVGPSSIEYYYESKGSGIPGWDKVLLVTAMKRGSLYVATLTRDGKGVVSPMSRYFQSEDRFRDTAISPDGRTIYIATDPGGMVESLDGGFSSKMENPGAILAFTYEREGTLSSTSGPRPAGAAKASTGSQAAATSAAGKPPQFTTAQAAAGRTAYNANCAVCHGSTLTNGTFGTPLGGEYFKKMWSSRNAKAFFDKSKTMPPAAPGSLKDEVYANIIAYILEVNGFQSGATSLPAGGEALEGMSLRP